LNPTFFTPLKITCIVEQSEYQGLISTTSFFDSKPFYATKHLDQFSSKFGFSLSVKKKWLMKMNLQQLLKFHEPTGSFFLLQRNIGKNIHRMVRKYTNLCGRK
jgi:hypothetical protein